MTDLCANSIAERQHDEQGHRQEVIRERFITGRVDELLSNGGADRKKLLDGISDQWSGDPEAIEAMLATLASRCHAGVNCAVATAAIVGWVKEVAVAIAEREWGYGDA